MVRKKTIEIESEDGSNILIKHGSEGVLGRGLGFTSEDQTVSRRHISFELHSSDEKNQNQNDLVAETMVSFEALGKNPTWVVCYSSGNVKAFRKFDKGEMRIGDQFCVSSRKPTLFTLKRIGFEEEEEDVKRVVKEVEGREGIAENEKKMLESIRSSDERSKGDEDLGLEGFDVSGIDPVKEFGFVLMGHEFDHYPKQMVRDINNWCWFLEEPREESEEDDETHKRKRSKGNKGVRRKKKDEGSDDEDWTGESEDDKGVIDKLRRDKRPKYSTRSKDHSKPSKDRGSSDKLVQKKTTHVKNNDEDDDDDEDEDEDEDNLGGFIVKDDMEEEADEKEREEEEEEEEEEEDYSDNEEE